MHYISTDCVKILALPLGILKWKNIMLVTLLLPWHTLESSAKNEAEGCRKAGWGGVLH